MTSTDAALELAAIRVVEATLTMCQGPCLAVPPLPDVLFHATERTFGPGTPLGSTSGHQSPVSLAPCVHEARAWATYVGQRTDSDRVAVYAVWVRELSGVRLDRRGVLPLPTLFADRAVVVQALEWHDPWAGARPGARESLRHVPF